MGNWDVCHVHKTRTWSGGEESRPLPLLPMGYKDITNWDDRVRLNHLLMAALVFAGVEWEEARRIVFHW